MAGFKTLNSADPSVRRPLRVSDLQDLWDGLGAIFTGIVPEDVVRVVAGFNTDTERLDEGILGEGVLYFNGKLYMYSSNTLEIGDTIVLYDVPADERVYADGQTRDFVFDHIADFEGAYDEAYRVDHVVLSEDFLGNKIIGEIIDGSVTASKLAVDSVSTSKIQRRAVTGNKIAQDAISFDQQLTGTHSLVFETAYGGVAKALPQRDTFVSAHVGGVGGNSFLFSLGDAVSTLTGKVLKHDILFDNTSDNAQDNVTVDVKDVNGGTKAALVFSLGARAKKLISVFVYYTININGQPTLEVYISE